MQDPKMNRSAEGKKVDPPLGLALFWSERWSVLVLVTSSTLDAPYTWRTGTEQDRQTDRQIDRQTDRQKDKQKEYQSQ